MAPNSLQKASRRASCEQCRQKKSRCDGVYPVCGRCLESGEECKYSSRLPMGRPKKRKAQAVNEPGVTVVSPSAQSTSDLRSSSSQEPELNGASNDVPTLDCALAPESDPSTWACEMTQDQQTDPTLLAMDQISTKPNTCACLATLYLSLDEIRTTDDMCFASGLSLLRKATQRAMTVLQCPICPSRLVWAMQNAQVLNTLLVTIAEAYQRLVASIEQETQQAQSLNESKAMWFGEAHTENPNLTPESVNDNLPSFVLSLSPPEWQKLTKRAIKAELHGAPHSSSTPFFAVLELMEERQLNWHASPSKTNSSCHAPHISHGSEPLCVTLVRQARGMVSRLSLDD